MVFSYLFNYMSMCLGMNYSKHRSASYYNDAWFDDLLGQDKRVVLGKPRVKYTTGNSLWRQIRAAEVRLT